MPDDTLDPVLVDLVARAMHDRAPMADPYGPEGSTTTWSGMPEMVRDDYRSEARAVLTALSAAGWGDVRQVREDYERANRTVRAERDQLLASLTELEPSSTRAAYERLEEAARAWRDSIVVQRGQSFTTTEPVANLLRAIAALPAPTKPVEEGDRG